MHYPLFSSADDPDKSIHSFRSADAGSPQREPDWQLHQLFDTDPRGACEFLFRKYYVALCSHASRFVFSRETAEDIVSEVFYLFYRDEAYKTVTISYRAYLMQAVRFRAYNYIRWELSKAQRNTDTDSLTLANHDPSPADMIQYDELYRAIEQAIDQLPPQTRRVFLLSRFEGRRYGEIAADLSISVKTVETHMSKALSLLRQAIQFDWMWLLLAGLLFPYQ